MNTIQVLPAESSGGASRAPVTGAFKVDISRGERIGRVSSEWFSRPDDERYLSLSTLNLLLEFLSLTRYMTIYMVRSVTWTQSIWRTPKPI